MATSPWREGSPLTLPCRLAGVDDGAGGSAADMVFMLQDVMVMKQELVVLMEEVSSGGGDARMVMMV